MNGIPLRLVAMLSFIAWSSLPNAQDSDQTPFIGDAEAGKEKAVVCFGCHGPDGISVAPGFPNIRGQKDVYLAKQLKYFRYRERDDPTMAGISQGLSNEDINNIAAYFYSLGRESTMLPTAAAPDTGAINADLDAGKKKATVCAACHGVDGVSTQRNYPNLRGQKRDYLVKQFTAFRDGPRKDPIMTPMLKAFSDQDIANVAAYFSCLPHPTPNNRTETLVSCNTKPAADTRKG